jgi:TRIAD3 protein (E3 ubiquitin-protein ligase RNF216)
VSSEALIAHILNKQDNGTSYPKAKDKLKTLKRKRQPDEDEEAMRKYGAEDRIIPATAGGVRPYIRTILQQEFSLTPANFIDATLSQSGHRLFSAYRVLEEAHRTYDSIEPPYNKIKKARKMEPHLEEAAVLAYLANPDADNEKVEVLKELQAARRIKKKADARRQEEREKELEEEVNTRRAEADGTMGECGCCFCDYPMNRMVHCDGEILHWFCRNCARMTAEVEIGKSKYEIQCMSTDKCTAGFAMDQRQVAFAIEWDLLLTMVGFNFLMRRPEWRWNETNKKLIFALRESRIWRVAPSALLQPSIHQWRLTANFDAKLQTVRKSAAVSANSNHIYPKAVKSLQRRTVYQ